MRAESGFTANRNQWKRRVRCLHISSVGERPTVGFTRPLRRSSGASLFRWRRSGFDPGVASPLPKKNNPSRSPFGVPVRGSSAVATETGASCLAHRLLNCG